MYYLLYINQLIFNRLKIIIFVPQRKTSMNETIEQQIKRLDFCRDCIDWTYKAGIW